MKKASPKPHTPVVADHYTAQPQVTALSMAHLLHPGAMAQSTSLMEPAPSPTTVMKTDTSEFFMKVEILTPTSLLLPQLLTPSAASLPAPSRIPPGTNGLNDVIAS